MHLNPHRSFNSHAFFCIAIWTDCIVTNGSRDNERLCIMDNKWGECRCGTFDNSFLAFKQIQDIHAILGIMMNGN